MLGNFSHNLVTECSSPFSKFRMLLNFYFLGKCAASCGKATFFYVSPSTFGSKWFGESEKLVMTLFEVAR